MPCGEEVPTGAWEDIGGSHPANSVIEYYLSVI